MNIYVGNMDFKTTEEELRALFEGYGKVESVKVIRDRDTGQPRGFAFVEMPNNEEGQKAIAAINGKTIGARALNVNEARPRVERGGGGGGGGRGFGGGGRDRGRY